MLKYEYLSIGTIIPLPQVMKETICSKKTTANNSIGLQGIEVWIS